MFNAAVLALLLGLPADAQVSPALALEVPPRETHWTEAWAVTLSTGRVFYDSHPNDPYNSGIWQQSHRQSEIRVTRQGTPLVVGVALQRIAYPDGSKISAMGAGLVLGAQHPLLSWLSVEFDGTLGLQRPSHYVYYMLDSPTAGSSSGPIESGPFELYARLGAGVALRVASWLDIPVRLNAHMQPFGESHSLGAASIGVRCLLP